MWQALERNKEAQTSQLQDLQNELKSLKSLLLNRTGQRPYTPTTGTAPPLSSSSSAPGLNLQSANGTEIPQTLNATHLSGMETPPLGAVGVPFGTGRPGIPAWQLAAREKAQQASKVEDETPATQV